MGGGTPRLYVVSLVCSGGHDDAGREAETEGGPGMKRAGAGAGVGSGRVRQGRAGGQAERGARVARRKAPGRGWRGGAA